MMIVSFARTRTGRRLVVAVLLAVAASVWLALPASASTIDRRTSYAAVRGQIDVVGDSTRWDFVVSKLGGTHCVYAKVALELSYPHAEYESARICADDPGNGIAFRGKATEYGTRAARVSLCVVLPTRPDHCEEVWRELRR
jgi:hypothetical protein